MGPRSHTINTENGRQLGRAKAGRERDHGCIVPAEGTWFGECCMIPTSVFHDMEFGRPFCRSTVEIFLCLTEYQLI